MATHPTTVEPGNFRVVNIPLKFKTNNLYTVPVHRTVTV
jgi:hypothetical protein